MKYLDVGNIIKSPETEEVGFELEDICFLSEYYRDKIESFLSSHNSDFLETKELELVSDSILSFVSRIEPTLKNDGYSLELVGVLTYLKVISSVGTNGSFGYFETLPELDLWENSIHKETLNNPGKTEFLQRQLSEYKKNITALQILRK